MSVLGATLLVLAGLAIMGFGILEPISLGSAGGLQCCRYQSPEATSPARHLRTSANSITVIAVSSIRWQPCPGQRTSG
jgi:hypothetical protein